MREHKHQHAPRDFKYANYMTVNDLDRVLYAQPRQPQAGPGSSKLSDAYS